MITKNYKVVWRNQSGKIIFSCVNSCLAKAITEANDVVREIQEDKSSHPQHLIRTIYRIDPREERGATNEPKVVNA